MGKYLTDWDYSKSQVNNIVLRNMCLNLKAISPLPDFHNRDLMSCKVYKPSLALYHQRQSFLY